MTKQHKTMTENQRCFDGLPEPDEFGTYWLGDRKRGPAIFRSKRLRGGRVESLNSWILLRDDERGFVFDGGNLLRFSTPLQALTHLNHSV